RNVTGFHAPTRMPRHTMPALRAVTAFHAPSRRIGACHTASEPLAWIGDDPRAASPYVGRALHILAFARPRRPRPGASSFFRPVPVRPTPHESHRTMPPANVTPKKMPFEKYRPYVPIVLKD